MRPVSAAWARTAAGSFTPFFRATVLDYFQTGTAPIGTRVPIVDGEVTLDGSADVYASGRLTLPGSYWPDPHGDHLVAPYGPEVYLQAGIKYRDDLVELVGLGYFRIRTVGQKRATISGPVEMSLSDRMAGIGRAVLLAPIAFPAATTNGEFAEALVTEVYPDAEIEWDDEIENLPIGRDVVVEDDRLAPLKSMALSVGKIVRFDHRGVLVFFTAPNPLDSQPVARLYGGRGGVLSEVSRDLSDEGVINAVVAKGDGADEVGGAYGLAIDLDPASVTRYDGPFGPSPSFIKSSLITSDDVAIIAANAELRRNAGLPHSLAFEVSPNYALEPDDLVEIEQPNSIGRHVIGSLTIPMIAGAIMSGVTRLQHMTFRDTA
jgi:hypothetical protein